MDWAEAGVTSQTSNLATAGTKHRLLVMTKPPLYKCGGARQVIYSFQRQLRERLTHNELGCAIIFRCRPSPSAGGDQHGPIDHADEVTFVSQRVEEPNARSRSSFDENEGENAH